MGEARRAEARETREAEIDAEETGEEDAHKETTAGELGTRGGDAAPEGVEVTEGGREREGRKLADESSG